MVIQYDTFDISKIVTFQHFEIYIFSILVEFPVSRGYFLIGPQLYRLKLKKFKGITHKFFSWKVPTIASIEHYLKIVQT